MLPEYALRQGFSAFEKIGELLKRDGGCVKVRRGISTRHVLRKFGYRRTGAGPKWKRDNPRRSVPRHQSRVPIWHRKEDFIPRSQGKRVVAPVSPTGQPLCVWVITQMKSCVGRSKPVLHESSVKSDAWREYRKVFSCASRNPFSSAQSLFRGSFRR